MAIRRIEHPSTLYVTFRLLLKGYANVYTPPFPEKIHYDTDTDEKKMKPTDQNQKILFWKKRGRNCHHS